MKTNTGTKPTPNSKASRIGPPRLIAIISSGVSLIIVVLYFYYFNEKGFNGINEKDEMVYLSRTPERAAESFLTALSEGEIERALRLSKGSAKEAVRDRSIFRYRIQLGETDTTPQTEEKSIRFSNNVLIDSANDSRKSNKSTPEAAMIRSLTARNQSPEEQKPSANGKLRRSEQKQIKSHYRPPDPLLFSVIESHRKDKNRVLLVGTWEGKNTERVYFRDVEVTVDRSDSCWYVTRVRFR